MEFADLIRRRAMVRRFDPAAPVSDEALVRALRAATRAPSAGFSQGVDLVVLRGAAVARYWELTRPLAAGGREAWVAGVSAAPVLVLCCADPEAYLDRYAEPDKGWTDRDPGRWVIPYWDVDAGMAALLMLLSAVDSGLGALFFGVPAAAHDAVRAAYGIPGSRRLVSVVALGHPLPGSRRAAPARPRRPFGDVVHDGRFGTAFDVPRPPMPPRRNGFGPRAPTLGGTPPPVRPTTSDATLTLRRWTPVDRPTGFTMPLITTAQVVLDLPATDRATATRTLAQTLLPQGRITDLDGFLDDVARRERQMATGLPGGIGIPHCRSGHVHTPSLVFGRCADGIDWGADDGPADLIFLIAAPEHGGEDHLAILAKLARKLTRPGFRQSLRAAADAAEVVELLDREVVHA